jgi:hypothetical protein
MWSFAPVKRILSIERTYGWGSIGFRLDNYRIGFLKDRWWIWAQRLTSILKNSLIILGWSTRDDNLTSDNEIALKLNNLFAQQEWLFALVSHLSSAKLQ